MKDKLRKIMEHYCSTMEVVLAILAGLALLVAAAAYVLSLCGLIPGRQTAEDFTMFLNDIFALVVGIEFIQMLLRPSVDNVIEVLVFLVTRHMILNHNSALDILGCVISILLLYAFHFFIHYLKSRYAELSHSIDKDNSPIGSLDEK